MGKFSEILKLHRETHEQSGPISSGHLSQVGVVIGDPDRRDDFLRKEAPSPNRSEARSVAKQKAVEGLETCQAHVNETIGKWHTAAVKKLMADPALPPDRWRIDALWQSFRAQSDKLDPIMVRAVWSTWSDEVKDAASTAPPQFRTGGNGLLQVVELVDAETREGEMRARRPDEAAQVDGLQRQLDVMTTLIGTMKQAILNDDGK